MEKLETIVKQEIQNAQGPQRSLVLKSQQERDKTIAVNLIHCFDSLTTYGADPDSLKSRQIVFSKVLDGYSPEQIDSAFERYLEIGKGLPEPSDILNILKERGAYNAPEYKVFDRRKEENHPCYIDLSDADKKKIDDQLARAKQALSHEPYKRKERDIESHFEKMPTMAQEEVLEAWKNTVIAQRAREKV